MMSSKSVSVYNSENYSRIAQAIAFIRQHHLNQPDLIFDSVTCRGQKSLTLLVKGTNFQIQVWRALLQVPFGGITTYQTIAETIDRPTATRAVGNAIANNPIGYLIPCHRVIRASGELGGYRWGLERKTAILGWEASLAMHEV